MSYWPIRCEICEQTVPDSEVKEVQTKDPWVREYYHKDLKGCIAALAYEIRDLQSQIRSLRGDED